MCLVPAPDALFSPDQAPAPGCCPVSVTLVVEQIKALPSAQQHQVLDLLHNHIYHPFYPVLAGPDYRP